MSDSPFRIVGPFTAKAKGSGWKKYKVLIVNPGFPNAGAQEWRDYPMRWWHPDDLRLFVRDRRRAIRQFGWVDGLALRPRVTLPQKIKGESG